MLKVQDQNSHWATCKLDEIQIRISNGANVTQFGSKVGYPISRIETIWNETIDFDRVKYIEESDDEFVKKYALLEGDILFSHINSDLHLGKTALFKNQNQKLIHGVNLLLIRLSERVSSSFINYQFKFLRHSGLFIANAQRSVNQSSINQAKLKSFDFLLPPFNEQLRIVEKIEELFSELDKGVENLKTAKAQLAVYRQALLKQAFEGKLTEQWRASNTDKLESPEQLLQRIQQERENRYEQQIEDWKEEVEVWNAGNEESNKPKKPRKPKDINNFESLPKYCDKLPDAWKWDKLGKMTLAVEYGTSTKSANEGLVPVLRMGNIQNLKFDWSDLVYTSDEDEIKKYKLKNGDVLFNRTNSPELVGKTAKYKGEQEALFAGYLIRVNHFDNFINSDYLNYFLNSYVSKCHGNIVKTDGVNQSNINGEKLSNYPFPYCSLKEQEQVVRILDEKLSLIERAEIEIASNLKKSEILRQSILKEAFSGQLVSQYLNDEPASDLLKKIAIEKAELAEKEKAEKAAARKSKSKAKAAAKKTKA